MLARLQRATTFGLLALALAAAWFGWRSGQPVAGAVAALFVVCGYAVVLAIEFAMMWAVHRDDPTPRATARQLVRAWIGELVAAPQVFCWRQPFRSRAWPDHLPAQASGNRGVLLVHGFVCNRGIWNRWLERLTAARVPFIAVDLEPVFGSLDDYAGVIEAAVRRLEAATGRAPVAVAHSMGGLALRVWWAEHDDARLHHAVTIGTPHLGTWLARFAMSLNARQMRHRGEWVTALAGREAHERAARCTCYYSHCDNIVFPATVATLPGADNRHLAGVAHVHMVDRPEPYAEVLARLASSGR